MSDLLLDLQAAEARVLWELNARPETRSLLYLRFAALEERGRVTIIAGGVTPVGVEALEPRHRAALGAALRRSADGLTGTKPAEAIARELRAGAWELERTGDERLAMLEAARLLEGDDEAEAA